MNQTTLSTKLSNVLKAVASRPTLPVLSHVLLKAENGTLIIAGCDLQTFIIERMEVDKSLELYCCPPGKLFTDLVGTFTSDIDLQQDSVHVYINGKKTKLKTIDGNEFPMLPELPDCDPATFEASELVYLIDRAIYAVSTEPSREILQGVHFDFGDTVKASAADGIRSAYCEYPVKVSLPSVTIPASFLKNLISALRGIDCTVSVWTTDTQALFSFGNTIMVSQLITGNFPDIKRLTPQKSRVNVTLNNSELKRLLNRLLKVALDDAHLVQIDIDQGKVVLFSDSPDVGECTDELEATVEGELYTTAFNGEYMRDILAVCGKQVTIEQNGPNSAFVVYTSDKRETEYHLLMPLHVNVTEEEPA